MHTDERIMARHLPRPRCARAELYIDGRKRPVAVGAFCNRFPVLAGSLVLRTATEGVAGNVQHTHVQVTPALHAAWTSKCTAGVSAPRR